MSSGAGTSVEAPLMSSERLAALSPVERFEHLRGPKPTRHQAVNAFFMTAGPANESMETFWVRWDRALGTWSALTFPGAEVLHWMGGFMHAWIRALDLQWDMLNIAGATTGMRGGWGDNDLGSVAARLEWTEKKRLAIVAEVALLRMRNADMERFGAHAARVAANDAALDQIDAPLTAFSQSLAPNLRRVRETLMAAIAAELREWKAPVATNLDSVPDIRGWQSERLKIRASDSVTPSLAGGAVVWQSSTIIDLQGEPHLATWRKAAAPTQGTGERLTKNLERWTEVTANTGSLDVIAINEKNDTVAFDAAGTVVAYPLHAVRYFRSKYPGCDVAFAALKGSSGTLLAYGEVRADGVRVGLVKTTPRLRDVKGHVFTVKGLKRAVAEGLASGAGPAAPEAAATWAAPAAPEVAVSGAGGEDLRGGTVMSAPRMSARKRAPTNPIERFEYLRGLNPTRNQAIKAFYMTAGPGGRGKGMRFWSRWSAVVGSWWVLRFPGSDLVEFMEHNLGNAIARRGLEHRLQRNLKGALGPRADDEEGGGEELEAWETESIATLETVKRLRLCNDDMRRFGCSAEKVAANNVALDRMQLLIAQFGDAFTADLTRERQARAAALEADIQQWRAPSAEGMDRDVEVSGWQPARLSRRLERAGGRAIAAGSVVWQTPHIIDLQGNPHGAHWRETALLSEGNAWQRELQINLARWTSVTRKTASITAIALHEGRDIAAFDAAGWLLVLPLHAVRYFHAKYPGKEVSFSALKGAGGALLLYDEARVGDVCVGFVKRVTEPSDLMGKLRKVVDAKARLTESDTIRSHRGTQ